MLRKTPSRLVGLAAVCAVILAGCPPFASGAARSSQADKSPVLIADACSSCGAELAPVAAVGAIVARKSEDRSLLTDSLWGNLILEMAYQRDKQLARLTRGMNFVNLGTMGMISGIAGGTLAQGILGLTTLNPPPGIQDSYVPGSIGLALSGATIATFAARAGFGYSVKRRIQKRQMELKHEVERVLAHLERSQAGCPEARRRLRDLIGERACNEWLQLWRSSHQVAMKSPPAAEPRISMVP